MKNRSKIVLAAFIGITLSASVLMASEIVGIYVRVDRVIFEPNEKTPSQIQVWGAFTTDRNSGVQQGYMYFRLPAGFHPVANEAAVKEWADLKAVAGTGQVVAFGQRFFTVAQQRDADAYYSSMPRVRPSSEKPQSPDLYPVNIGLAKVSNSPVVDRLRSAKD